MTPAHRRRLALSTLSTLSVAALAACLEPTPGREAVVPHLDPFVALSVGALGPCGLTAEGRAVCFPEDAPGFEIVARGADVVAAGGTLVWHEELMACALGAGVVTCANGQRGYTLEAPGATLLAVGDHLACAATPAGATTCWDPLAEGLPETAAGPTLAAPRELTCGFAFCCARDAVGDVACWGDGARGELAPDLPFAAVAVSAGYAHACALSADGASRCWGDGAPQLPAGVVAADLDAGMWRVCAIERGTGLVVCAQSDTVARWSLGVLAQVDVGGHVCGRDPGGAIVCAPEP